MAPHLDAARAIERAHAAELYRAARSAVIEEDQSANAARILEQVADGSAGVGGTSKGSRCGCCGSPVGKRDIKNLCDNCRQRDWEVVARAKLSDDEIYPENK